jgi:hypothetical protein
MAHNMPTQFLTITEVTWKSHVVIFIYTKTQIFKTPKINTLIIEKIDSQKTKPKSIKKT